MRARSHNENLRALSGRRISCACVRFRAQRVLRFLRSDSRVESLLQIRSAGRWCWRTRAAFVRGRNGDRSSLDLRGPTPVAGTIRTGQMYVQFRIPVKSNGVPVVMVHGANHSGVTYETTPDGREGWATYFVRTGFPTYVVDQPAAVAPVSIRLGSTAPRRRATHPRCRRSRSRLREAAWASYRLGPKYPEFWPDSRFPQAALDHYFSQAAPMADGTLPGAIGEQTVAAVDCAP